MLYKIYDDKYYSAFLSKQCAPEFSECVWHWAIDENGQGMTLLEYAQICSNGAALLSCFFKKVPTRAESLPPSSIFCPECSLRGIIHLYEESQSRTSLRLAKSSSQQHLCFTMENAKPGVLLTET